MISKIDFFIRCRVGGGFIACAQAPAHLEAEAETLAALRVAVKRAVRAKLGADRPVCLRVGGAPPVRHMAVVPPSAEIAAEP